MHINEFQEMMRRLYFHRDSERGVEKTFEWLVEEVAELGEALKTSNRKALEKRVCRRHRLAGFFGKHN